MCTLPLGHKEKDSDKGPAVRHQRGRLRDREWFQANYFSFVWHLAEQGKLWSVHGPLETVNCNCQRQTSRKKDVQRSWNWQNFQPRRHVKCANKPTGRKTRPSRVPFCYDIRCVILFSKISLIISYTYHHHYNALAEYFFALSLPL